VRIGIDGRALQGSRAGIGRYVFELCRELDRLLPSATFFVYAPGPVELPVSSARWVVRIDPSPLARVLKPIAWLKLRAGRLCREDGLDAFWGAATFLPTLPRGVRTICTVYDVNFRVVPSSMSRTHRLAHQLFFERDVTAATHRIAISSGTSARLQAYFGVRVSAIARPGVSPVFQPRQPDAVRAVEAEAGIDGPYFLAVGTWEPRKNLELLVRVFRSLRSSGLLEGHRLVLVGGRGWKDQQLHRLLTEEESRSRDGSKDVVALGYTSDEMLAHLYSGCKAFVFPSTYEGFGLPVAEARACGARVITTDIPELREAGGPDTVYIAPTPEGLRRSLLDVPPPGRAQPRSPAVLPSWSDAAKVVARYLGDG
jgi:glycosyltransferase involved in cell wall biosynthesis